MERSGVNSELVKRILNFLMHPKPSGKPLTKIFKNFWQRQHKRNRIILKWQGKLREPIPEILSDNLAVMKMKKTRNSL